VHSLSVCGPEEFNCEDGSCINLDVRCEYYRIVAEFIWYSLCIFLLVQHRPGLEWGA
jgi:hypothetical protein